MALCEELVVVPFDDGIFQGPKLPIPLSRVRNRYVDELYAAKELARTL